MFWNPQQPTGASLGPAPAQGWLNSMGQPAQSPAWPSQPAQSPAWPSQPAQSPAWMQRGGTQSSMAQTPSGPFQGASLAPAPWFGQPVQNGVQAQTPPWFGQPMQNGVQAQMQNPQLMAQNRQQWGNLMAMQPRGGAYPTMPQNNPWNSAPNTGQPGTINGELQPQNSYPNPGFQYGANPTQAPAPGGGQQAAMPRNVPDFEHMSMLASASGDYAPASQLMADWMRAGSPAPGSVTGMGGVRSLGGPGATAWMPHGIYNR